MASLVNANNAWRQATVVKVVVKTVTVLTLANLGGNQEESERGEN